MSDRVYGPDEKGKLERIIAEGVSIMQEVDDLQAGSKDTVKHIAEELNVKPTLINKAIKVAYKRDWDKHVDDFEDLETIVSTVGVDK